MKKTLTFLLLLPFTIGAATITWDNGGGDNLWNSATNWVGDIVPGVGDSVVFNGTTSTANCTINVAISVKSINMRSNYPGTLVQNAGNTITLTGTYAQFNGKFIGSDAAITVSRFILDDNIGTWDFDFKSTSGTLTVTGITFLFSGLEYADPGSGGAFIHNNGKILFTGAVSFDGGANASDFWDMEINGGNVTTTFGQIIVTNQLDLTNGYLNTTTTVPVIVASGNITFGQNFDGGSGTGLQLMPISPKTWDFRGDAFDRYLPGIEVRSSNVTIYFNNNASYKTYIGGDLDIELGTVVGSSSDLYITRDLRMAHEGLGTPNITLSSNTTSVGRHYYYYNDPTFSHNNGTLVFNTSVNTQILLTGSASAVPFYHVSIEKTGVATASIMNNIDVDGNLTLNGTSSSVSMLSFSSNTIYLAGNFNDMSTSDKINQGTGTLYLDGSLDQTLTSAYAGGGTGTGSNFYNFTVNKAGGGDVYLAGAGHISVFGTLTLTDGVIHSSLTNLFILENNAASSIGNTNSFVDGVVDFKMGISGVTRTLLLPIASGNDWRPLELTVRHSAATSYTYRAFLSLANPRDFGLSVAGTIQQLTSLKYHTITRYTTTTGSETKSTDLTVSAGLYPKVKLYYKATPGINDDVTDYANLTIAKTNAADNAWEDLWVSGGTANGTGSITSSDFNSFSKFCLANRGTNVLSIGLSVFKVLPGNNGNEIKWLTASESNNNRFVIEASTDGLHFEDIASIPGAGNSSVEKEYSYQDKNTLHKYYRLRSIDHNGQERLYEPEGSSKQ